MCVCVYVCMCVYMYTCVCVYIYIYIYTYTYTRTYIDLLREDALLAEEVRGGQRRRRELAGRLYYILSFSIIVLYRTMLCYSIVWV